MNFTWEGTNAQITEAIKFLAPCTHSPTQALNKLFVEPSAIPAITNQGTSMETSRSSVVPCHSLIIPSVFEWKKSCGWYLPSLPLTYVQNTYKRGSPGINYERQWGKHNPRSQSQAKFWIRKLRKNLRGLSELQGSSKTAEKWYNHDMQ